MEVAFQLKQQCNLLNNYNKLKKCLQTINATAGDTYGLPLLSNVSNNGGIIIFLNVIRYL